LLCARGEVAESEALSRRGLQAAESHWGPQHPAALACAHSLAAALEARGEADELESLRRKLRSAGGEAPEAPSSPAKPMRPRIRSGEAEELGANNA